MKRSSYSVLFILFWVLGNAAFLQAQGGGCSDINYTLENYQPCCYRLHVDNSSDCFPFIRLLIDAGEFTTWGVGTGWTGEQISPTEILLTHSSGIVPLGASIPIGFCLPPGVSPNLTILYDYICGIGKGCFFNIPIEGCPIVADACISGVKYRECGQLPYTNQPTLADWTITLLDAMGNTMDSMVTGVDGAYQFCNLAPGNYYVKETSKPGWTSNVPASGQYAVSLAQSELKERNFGNCPACSCDSISFILQPISPNGNNSCFNLSVLNTGPSCFNFIEISLASGQFTSTNVLEPGWSVVTVNPQLLRLFPPGAQIPVGSFSPIAFCATGGATLNFTVGTTLNNGGNPVSCSRAFSYPNPPAPSPNCCPAGYIPGPELATNADFEAGNTGFTSALVLICNCATGTYCVKSNFNTKCPGWPSFLDHTTGTSSGHFLIVDGHKTLQKTVWGNNVPVVNGETYCFSFWAASVYADPFDLGMTINGVIPAGGTQTISQAYPNWTFYSVLWTSNVTGTIPIKIDQMTGGLFRDFGLDDISFHACTTPPCETSINVTPLDNCGLVQVAAITTGIPSYSYQWCDATTSETQTLQLPCGPHTFCVTATCGNGSTSTATVTYVVSDPIPPVALCQPGFGVTLNPNCTFTITPAMIDNGSTDNCQILSMSVSPSVLTGCKDTLITLTVTDWCNNTSTCTTGIQTLEVVPPGIILCPNNVALNGTPTPQGGCTAIWLPPVVLGQDNCDPNPVVTSNAPAGNIYSPGTTTVIWTVTDACGNTASCSNTVTVVCPCGSTDCPGNLVQNPGFYLGAVSGELSNNGHSDDWQKISVSPEVEPSDYCCDAYCMQMHQTEAICQGNLNFQQGHTYRITFCARFRPTPGLSFNSIGFRFTADSDCTVGGNFEVMGASNQITNTNWATYTLPNWTATQNWNSLQISAFTPNGESAFGRLDNICVEEVVPVSPGCIRGVTYSECNQLPYTSQPKLPDWTITLLDTTGLVVASTVTDVSGAYAFCDLPPGQYVVKSALQPGWTTNIPASGQYAVSLGASGMEERNFGVCQALCTCGTFSNACIRSFTKIACTPLICGGAPVTLQCPVSGYSYDFTAQFGCQGGCVNVPVSWQFSGPGGTFSGIVTATPFFSIQIFPTYFGTPGIYTLTLQGDCNGSVCVPCVFTFNIVCADPCPCDLVDFQADVNQGFANALYYSACKTCFSPLDLTDCDEVEWFVNGISVGTAGGRETFCHDFSASGSYTVMMSVTRKKSDGTICGVLTFSKIVTLSCSSSPDCNNSVFLNPTFSEGAVAGGLNSSGASAGWYGPCGEPQVVSDFPGSLDGWTIHLSGNLDSADVLATIAPVYLEKGKGTMSVRTWGDPHEGAYESPKRDKWKFQLYRGDNFEMEGCDSVSCFSLGTIDASPFDTGWLDLQLPYDLTDWTALDSVDASGKEWVLVRPAIFVTSAFGYEQGGAATRANVQIDQVCLSADCAVAFTSCPASVTLVDCDNSGNETITWPIPTAGTTGNCSAFTLTQVQGPTGNPVVPLGSYQISYIAQASGQFGQSSAICTFNVHIVSDLQAPAFAFCPPDITLQGTFDVNGNCSVPAAWTLPVAIDGNDCIGSPVTLQGNVQLGALLPAGPNLIVYTAADASNNTATCSFTATVTCIVSTHETEKTLFAFRILPNPNPGVFSVELPLPAVAGMSFRVVDLLGQALKEPLVQPGIARQTIQATDLPPGLYFLQVVSAGRVVAVEKFVKQ